MSRLYRDDPANWTADRPTGPATLERLAAIEHDQWEKWSREVAEQGLTPERIERWHRYWVPYSQLDEATKEHDRVWARRVIEVLEHDGLTPAAERARILAALPEALALAIIRCDIFDRERSADQLAAALAAAIEKVV